MQQLRNKYNLPAQHHLLKALLPIILLITPWADTAYPNGWEHTTIPMAVLQSALQDPSAEIRMRAAHSLGYRHQPVAFEYLATLISNGEPVPGVRQAAYQSMGKIGYLPALEHLEYCLTQDKEISVRSICASALANFKSNRSETLVIGALDDKSQAVRNAAISSLGNFSSETVRKILVHILSGESDAEQSRAISALGNTKNPQAVEALLPLIDINTEESRLIEILKAVTFLGVKNDSDKLAEIYLNGKSDRVRRFALMALSSSQEDGGDNYAMQSLEAEDPLTRLQGLEILRESTNKKLTREIVNAGLKHAKKLLQRPPEWFESNESDSIIDLSLLNEFLRTIISLDPRYGYELFALVSKPANLSRSSPLMLKVAEGFYNARWQGIYALGYTYNPGAEKLLSQGIRDSDPRIRSVALRSMGVYGARPFLQEVVTASKDDSAEVRWTAARVLGRNRNPDNINTLLPMLEDIHLTVRKEAALSLGYLGNKQAINELTKTTQNDPAISVREAALFALALFK